MMFLSDVSTVSFVRQIPFDSRDRQVWKTSCAELASIREVHGKYECSLKDVHCFDHGITSNIAADCR